MDKLYAIGGLDPYEMDRKEWKEDVDLLPSITSGLQFGFKQKMSTTLCTGAVKNIVSRYWHENSAVFACFLDASKAFDLVNQGYCYLTGSSLLILFASFYHGTRNSTCV